MIDLSGIRTQQTAELEILHPGSKERPDLSGRSIGVFFVLAGSTHDLRKKAKLAVDRKIQEAVAAGRIRTDDDDVEAFELELMVAATLGWHGPKDETTGEFAPVCFWQKDMPTPFSREECERLYADPGFAWLRAQVRRGLERSSLFVSGSPTT